MSCAYEDVCGGCVYRDLSKEQYQALKLKAFEKALAPLGENLPYAPAVFIADGCRRRAALTFCYRKKQLVLGFNQKSSEVIVDIATCGLLTPKLNANLENIRKLILAVCQEPYNIKKGKKFIPQTINLGDILICEADNGIDVVLEYDAPLELNHRMALFELVQNMPDIIRLSHRKSVSASIDPIMEKSKPFIKVGNFDVYIPAGTFLQPSSEGEAALTGLVQKYLAETTGKIADLFCGVGTFSYVLAGNIKNKILAVDSSAELLGGFRESVNKNQIPNIEIRAKNLFKYPLDAADLKGLNAIVLDPPRAGAAAQIKQIAELSDADKPLKVIMVSCNPHTFLNDAKALLIGGYQLQEITMVDQFVYSNHSELVALFTKKQS